MLVLVQLTLFGKVSQISTESCCHEDKHKAPSHPYTHPLSLHDGNTYITGWLVHRGCDAQQYAETASLAYFAGDTYRTSHCVDEVAHDSQPQSETAG